jgi:hypothetical protein
MGSIRVHSANTCRGGGKQGFMLIGPDGIHMIQTLDVSLMVFLESKGSQQT